MVYLCFGTLQKVYIMRQIWIFADLLYFTLGTVLFLLPRRFLKLQGELSMFPICPVHVYSTCICVHLYMNTLVFSVKALLVFFFPLVQSVVVQQRSRPVNYGCAGNWEAVSLTFLWFTTFLNTSTSFPWQHSVGYLMWSFIHTFAFLPSQRRGSRNGSVGGLVTLSPQLSDGLPWNFAQMFVFPSGWSTLIYISCSATMRLTYVFFLLNVLTTVGCRLFVFWYQSMSTWTFPPHRPVFSYTPHI